MAPKQFHIFNLYMSQVLLLRRYVSYLHKGDVFCRVLQFPPSLTTGKSQFCLNIAEKVTI